jgi:hypothetical protein
MIRTWIAAGLIAASSIVALTPTGWASTFAAWRVADVAANDLLNVRAWPSSQSRALVGYPNGAVLSMTGRCTGGVRLGEIQRLPAWRQRQIARRQWCEVWLDPHGTGAFRNGWVYGRYIRPA